MSVYHGAAGNVRENKNKAVVLSLFSLLPTPRCCPTHARNDSLADTQNNRTRKASRASPKRTTPSIPLIGRKSNDSLQWGAAAALCSRKLRTWAEGRQMGHRSDLLLERAQISASPVFLAGRCASCVPAFFRAVRRAHRAYTPSGWPPMDLNGSKLRVWVRSGVPRVGHLAPWPHMVLDPPAGCPGFRQRFSNLEICHGQFCWAPAAQSVPNNNCSTAAYYPHAPLDFTIDYTSALAPTGSMERRV